MERERVCCVSLPGKKRVTNPNQDKMAMIVLGFWRENFSNEQEMLCERVQVYYDKLTIDEVLTRMADFYFDELGSSPDGITLEYSSGTQCWVRKALERKINSKAK